MKIHDMENPLPGSAHGRREWSIAVVSSFVFHIVIFVLIVVFSQAFFKKELAPLKYVEVDLGGMDAESGGELSLNDLGESIAAGVEEKSVMDMTEPVEPKSIYPFKALSSIAQSNPASDAEAEKTSEAPKEKTTGQTKEKPVVLRDVPTHEPKELADPDLAGNDNPPSTPDRSALTGETITEINTISVTGRIVGSSERVGSLKHDLYKKAMKLDPGSGPYTFRIKGYNCSLIFEGEEHPSIIIDCSPADVPFDVVWALEQALPR